MIIDALKPQEPQYRTKFDHYGRLMLRALWLGPLLLLPILVATIVIANTINVSESTFSTLMMVVGVVWLGGAASFMGYCEIKRTLIFREDLRHRSTAGSRAGES
jgi:hypothetical protein